MSPFYSTIVICVKLAATKWDSLFFFRKLQVVYPKSQGVNRISTAAYYNWKVAYPKSQDVYSKSKSAYSKSKGAYRKSQGV